MGNSKRTTKIIKALNEATISPDEVQQNISDLVTVAKDELDMTDDSEAKDFVSGLVGEGDGVKQYNDGIGNGVDQESGDDEYEEFRKLKAMLVGGESDEIIDEDNDPVKLKNDVAKVMAKLDMSSIKPYLARIDNPVEQAEMIAQFAEVVGVPKQRLQGVIAQLKDVAKKQDGGQIDEDNNTVKLRHDVAKVMTLLDMSAIAPHLKKINNDIEQAEMMAQFGEKIGIDRADLGRILAQLKITSKKKDVVQQVEGKMTKKKLIETVVGKKSNRVIKTIKVKDIK